jgi:hypothetical protein
VLRNSGRRQAVEIVINTARASNAEATTTGIPIKKTADKKAHSLSVSDAPLRLVREGSDD